MWRAAARNRTANSPKVLDRLIGLETEYAAIFESSKSAQPPPTGQDIFDFLCLRLETQVPLASADHNDRKFLANGGAVSLETSVNKRGDVTGLIEGATPECRSPATLLAYQIAQDELFEQLLEETPWNGRLRLLKNSADPVGHFYGIQENYEMEIASGWRLWLFRTLMFLLLPVVAIYWLLSTLWLLQIQLLSWSTQYLATAAKSLRNVFRFARKRAQVPVEEAASDSVMQLESANASSQTGAEVNSATAPDTSADVNQTAARSSASPLSGLPLRCAVFGLRVLHAPLAFGLSLILKSTVLTLQRNRLEPFLATRVILDGAGHLDGAGRFWLGAKASVVDSWIGLGGYWGGRPVFVFGHWLKMLCAPGPRPWKTFWKLLRQRQRVQVALGDSSMSSVSQYLRTGITALVLDWAEQASASEKPPTLIAPLEALRRVARDELLIAKLPDIHGHNWTALEIQQFYLSQVKDFLQQSWQVPAEAWRIVRLWQETLDSLQLAKHDSVAKQQLLGKVDWVSKRWMFEQVAPNAAWMVRKKIDLRYHELSEDGYYRKLVAAAGRAVLITRDKIQQAKRVPPVDTIAAKRGYLIREFSGCDTEITAAWDHVRVSTSESITDYDLANDFWNSSNK